MELPIIHLYSLPDSSNGSTSQADTTAGILQLLKENGLPYTDLEENKDITFIAAKQGDKMIGCIGIEKSGTEGLLRSFVVEAAHRNQGTGCELLNHLIMLTMKLGIRNLHLLTTTAEFFFLKKGFVKTDRAKAPDCIQQTTEFNSLCPSSAIYMVLHNINEA